MVHALSEESLPPRVPLQCLTGDSAAAALNGAQRRPARHRRWKRRGLGGPGGAVGLALPTLRSASPVVEPRPTEEGAQPITLQHCSWEKTGAASEPVGYRVWLALGPVPPPALPPDQLQEPQPTHLHSHQPRSEASSTRTSAPAGTDSSSARLLS